MNQSSFNSDRSSDGDVCGGGDFFYSNLRLQETLATVRYGIESRKGLIILTGDSGTGKTIHLHKITTEAASNVICILEPDPSRSFADILRAMLQKLNCEISDREESALIRACRDELRARTERCQIVALLLDNAHHLPDQTIQKITQNFIGIRNDDAAGPLLQLVLAGRPELRSKLSHAALIPLRRRRPIVCELTALNSGEIGPYIQGRLRANNRPQDLFAERAIKRMALYTRGNPRTINALYDRVLQIGEANSVAPELVDGAARDLDLHASEFSDSGSRPAGQPPEFTLDRDIPEIVEPAFPARFEDCVVEPHHEASRKKISTRVWTLLIVFGFAALMISAGTPGKFLQEWSAQLAAPVSHQQLWQSGQPGPQMEPAAQPAFPTPVPGPDFPTALQSNDTAKAPAPRSSADVTPEVIRKSSQERRIPSAEKPAPVNTDIQTQVTKAIESRAIMGIEVSVVQGTAFLDGHVATERQRRAAENAARSVVGVERVRNRIAITFG